MCLVVFSVVYNVCGVVMLCVYFSNMLCVVGVGVVVYVEYFVCKVIGMLKECFM